jgi:hypothetical protein
MNYIPLVMAHIDEDLYQQAKDQLLNMTYADYFYIISYPTYGGYRIEHDPIYTAYLASPETIDETVDQTPNLGGILVLGAIAAVAIIVVVVLLRRKK